MSSNDADTYIPSKDILPTVKCFSELFAPLGFGLVLTIASLFVGGAIQYNLFSALAILALVIVFRLHVLIQKVTEFKYPTSPQRALKFQLVAMLLPIFYLLFLSHVLQPMSPLTQFLRQADSVLSQFGHHLGLYDRTEVSLQSYSVRLQLN